MRIDALWLGAFGRAVRVRHVWSAWLVAECAGLSAGDGMCCRWGLIGMDKSRGDGSTSRLGKRWLVGEGHVGGNRDGLSAGRGMVGRAALTGSDKSRSVDVIREV